MNTNFGLEERELNGEEQVVVSSRMVAEKLGKRPADVIRGIENILTNANLRSLIIPSEYVDKKGEVRKEYLLTKDGFTLYMFNIQGHNELKMAYINKFNEMERYIKELQQAPQYLTIDKDAWRKEVLACVRGVATLRCKQDKIMYGKSIAYTYKEIYKELNYEAGVNLKSRVTRRRNNMTKQGICKTKVDKIREMDLIVEQEDLIKQFTSIVINKANSYAYKLDKLEQVAKINTYMLAVSKERLNKIPEITK